MPRPENTALPPVLPALIDTPSAFTPRDPVWSEKVKASFDRQQVMHLLGAELSRIEPGFCEIRLPFRPQLSQQNGYFHAGITSTVVDSAAGYAGFSLMPANTDVLSVEFKINMLAPGLGDYLVARGYVIKPGKQLVITRGEAYVVKHTPAGDKVTHSATMQQTLMVMRLPTAALHPSQEKEN